MITGRLTSNQLTVLNTLRQQRVWFAGCEGWNEYPFLQSTQIERILKSLVKKGLVELIEESVVRYRIRQASEQP